MGVERAVIRWYIQRQPIITQLIALQTQLQQLSPEGQSLASDAAAQYASLTKQLFAAQQKLDALGPCPKPMMG